MSAPFALVFGGGAFRDMTLPKAPLDELYRRPGFMIRRAHQISVSLFLEETGELGITNRQYGILLVLKHQPGIDQITVAKLLGLDRSTTGMVLTKLEQAGLVGRVVGAKDRRKRSLALTPAGSGCWSGSPSPRAGRRARAVGVHAAGGQTFLDLLDKFARAFNETTRVPQVVQHADKKRRFNIVIPRRHAAAELEIHNHKLSITSMTSLRIPGSRLRRAPAMTARTFPSRYGSCGSSDTSPRSPRGSPTTRRRISWRSRGTRGSPAPETPGR